MRAASWVGKRLGDFEVGTSKPSSTLGDVEVHLRALPGLSKAGAEGLVALVKGADDAAADVSAKKGAWRQGAAPADAGPGASGTRRARAQTPPGPSAHCS